MPFDGQLKKRKRTQGDIEYDIVARSRTSAFANIWLARQSKRLGISESELLDLVKKGWLPHFIEGTPAGCLSDFERAPGVAAILAGCPIFDSN
jgi:hypothetical protein